MTVFQDAIYATSYDEGSVFRYDGESGRRLEEFRTQLKPMV